jgi:predicted amidohydrolase YtcJ
MGLVASRIPKPGERELVEAIDAALCEARKQGITSIHDITLLEQLPAFQKLDREGKLTCRVYARLPLSHYRTLVAQGIRVGSGTARLRLGSVKAFCDGSLGSSTAWFFEPYEDDTSNCGLAMDVVTDGSLRTWAMDADRNGLQLSVHAIGDRANATVLSLFQEIRGENPPWDRRFRIEHAQHVRPDDIPRFRELDVIVSAQPYHCIDDGVWAERKIGPARGRWAYPFGAFLKAGVRVCFGSDWTVAPLNTLAGMYAAMTRQPIDGGKPDGWHPEEKISVRDAIRCYTLNNAYASFEENTKGSITPGKLADLVVLKENILECDPSCVRDASVLMTVFDGTIL